MKFKNHFNTSEFPKTYETVNPISQTIPDQSLSIREIMDRYARGISMHNQQKMPIYNGEDDLMPELSKLDLAEREQIILEAKEELEHLQQKHEQYIKQKQTKPKYIQTEIPNNESEKTN